MTPLKLLIAGIDRTAWLANGYSIDVEKVLSTETFHLAILDLDSTAGALRPAVGDAILLTRTDEGGDDIELLFGGAIADVTDEPIVDDSGTVTRIRCRDQMVLADHVFMPPRTYDAAPVREVFTAIVEEYLGPKGVFVISDPSGGPPLPELRIDDFVTTVRQVLDRITLQCGWPWRINGEKAAGIIEPGELPGPATLSDDGASVLTDPPLRWQQQVLTHATRVFVQTSAPESESGPVVYHETVIPPSGTSVVPVHVLPTEIRGSASADAASGATSLSLQNLPKNASIRIGARLTIDTQTTVYTLTSPTTTNVDGQATVALSVGLEAAVKDGQAITFLRGAFVQLELNGVVTPMDGLPYVWEPIENAIVYPAGDLGGIAVVYRTWVLHPTMVREWDPSAQQPIGWFDYAAVIDQQITEEEGHTDLATARTFAQAELAKRLAPPKRVTCTTRIPGHYPLLLVPLDFPDRLVTGDYLVTETRIRHSTIDENSDEQPLLYELVLMEGDALGESWIQYFRGRNPSQGVRWGGLGDALVAQAPLEVLLQASDAFVAQAPVEVLLQGQDALVAQAPLEVLLAADASVIALVSRRQNTVNPAAVSSMSTASGSHTAGHLLVVMVSENAAGSPTVSDTAGNTFADVGADQLDGYGNRVRVYYAYNITGHASNVVTVTFTSGTSTYAAVSVREFSGDWVNAPTVADVDGASGNSTTPTTPTLTVPATQALLYSAEAAAGAGNTAGAGFTLNDYGGFGVYFSDQYKVDPDGGNQAISCTMAGSDQWAIVGVAFIPNP